MQKPRISPVSAFLAGIILTMSVSNVTAALKGSAVFSDVPAGHYADQAIGDAFAQGVMSGYDSTRFGPNDAVTRGQLALILSRLNLVRGTTNPPPTPPPPPSTSNRSSKSSSSSSVTASSSSSSSIPYSAAGQLRFDAAQYVQNEEASSHQVVVTIVRTGGNQGTVSVQYSFASGSAVVGTDYSPLNGTVTFGNKETSKKVMLEIKDDSNADGNKTVLFKLMNPTGGAVLGNPSTATLTLIDNETNQSSSSAGATNSSSSAGALFSFSAVGYSVMENGGSVTITVNRTGLTTGANSVNYATSNGTATSGVDYSGTNGTFAFAAGETSKTFTVSVVDNSTVDGDRKINLTLSNATNLANVSTPSTATITIVDNEAATAGSGSFKFSTANFTVLESVGNAAITVVRVGGVSPVSVNYMTNGGTALVNSDYTSVSGTLNFAQGETSKMFFVPILRDTTTEGEEQVNLTLSNPSNGLTFIDPSSATLKISD